MLNYIWAGLILISLIFGIVNGRIDEVTNALYSGANNAVNACITLAGVMSVWGGFIKIAENSGATAIIGRMLSPLIRLLFPTLKKGGKAANAISMNMAANMLGLGNAATPLGIEAMKQLQAENPDKTVASDNMVTFVVLNTASIQIIPTTISALRSRYGASNPMDILPLILITSLLALAVGLTVNFLFILGTKGARVWSRKTKLERVVI
ncbi:MAG TPA: spore maturation protein A [Clostridiales bacterium]|nr:spore maturation protein A [Clostridiales bacterium]